MLILVLARAGTLIAGRSQGYVLVVTLLTIWLPAFAWWATRRGDLGESVGGRPRPF